jgi:hypothetical protein
MRLCGDYFAYVSVCPCFTEAKLNQEWSSSTVLESGSWKWSEPGKSILKVARRVPHWYRCSYDYGNPAAHPWLPLWDPHAISATQLVHSGTGKASPTHNSNTSPTVAQCKSAARCLSEMARTRGCEKRTCSMRNLAIVKVVISSCPTSRF